MREPAIAWWPGKIRQGKTVEVKYWIMSFFCLTIIDFSLQLAATVDIFPTVMNLVGGKLPDVTLDGVDMAPILFDNKEVCRGLVCLQISYLYASPTFSE